MEDRKDRVDDDLILFHQGIHPFQVTHKNGSDPARTALPILMDTNILIHVSEQLKPAETFPLTIHKMLKKQSITRYHICLLENVCSEYQTYLSKLRLESQSSRNEIRRMMVENQADDQVLEESMVCFVGANKKLRKLRTTEKFLDNIITGQRSYAKWTCLGNHDPRKLSVDMELINVAHNIRQETGCSMVLTDDKCIQVIAMALGIEVGYYDIDSHSLHLIPERPEYQLEKGVTVYVPADADELVEVCSKRCFETLPETQFVIKVPVNILLQLDGRKRSSRKKENTEARKTIGIIRDHMMKEGQLFQLVFEKIQQ